MAKAQPITLSIEDRELLETLVRTRTRKPTEFGYAAELWTYAKLTKHIHKVAANEGHTRLP